MKHDWEYKKLGESCILTMGQSPSSDSYNSEGEGLPFFQGCSDFGLIHPTITTFCTAPTKIAQADDVLMSVRAPIGTLNIADVECCIGRGLASFRANNDGVSKFLYYVLKYSKDKLQSLGTGSTFKAIGKDSLRNFIIPVPPLPIQEQIVSELDKVSEIIEKKKQQVKELDNLAQSIFYDMFGDPVENEKGWEVKKMNEVGEIVAGSTPSTTDSENWDGEINWVTPAELGSQLYYGETQRKLTEKGARGLAMMPIGTVLLSSRAPIGKLAITTVEMCCNQGFKNIVCKDFVNNIFLYHYLLYTIDEVKALGVGATFKEVSKKAISAYKVILPPLDLQKSFAQKIEVIEKQKELITASIKEAQTLFDARMDYWFGE